MKRISKKDSKITLVELPPTLYGELGGDTGHDVYTQFGLPPRATPYLAGVLERDGWENVRQYHQYSSEDIRGGIEGSDVLCISAITRTAPQSMELAKRYREAYPEAVLIAGGMDASYRIEEWLDCVDVIVKGEGERTFSQLMSRLAKGDELDGLAGIAFKDSSGSPIVTSPQEIMGTEELSRLPLPIYDSDTLNGINIYVIENERGCPHECNYCLVHDAYGNKVRHKSPERVINEIRHRRRQLGGMQYFLSGDNTAANPAESRKVLDTIHENGLYRDNNTAQVSVAAAWNPLLLQSMRNAGIRSLCVGFESRNDASLNEIGKPFNARQNDEAAKIFHDWGFWVHGMMMLGSDSDTPEVARETSEWANENLDSLQLFIPTPFKGTPFWDRMASEGRIITNDLSLYDAQHCIIRPMNFTPYELQKTVFDIYDSFYSNRQTFRRLFRTPVPKFTMGFWAWTKFLNGLKGITSNPQTLDHIKFLKEIS